jgi:cytochrome c oxidase cbb3-type subunit 4
MLSGIITIALLLLFVAGWIWAWRPARKAGFDAAARLALDEGDALDEDRQAQAKGDPR